MTTIAYKDGLFAYDSLITQDGTITDNNFDKRHVVNNVVFFITGAVSDFPLLIDAYFGKDVGNKVSCRAFVIDGDDLYECAVADDCGFWKMKFRRENHRAIGSGCYFALAAMDLGCDALKAVKVAASRDTATGGKIRVYRI